MFDYGKMKDRKFMQYLVIVLFVLITSGLLFLFRSIIEKDGIWVVVILNGEEQMRYSLVEDGTYYIYGEGIEYNKLVILNGEASIVEANCKNQFCVHSKAISHNGETITCLPHKIQITIEGGEDTAYDGFTG